MNNKIIAKELLKVARMLKAGGGAGIEFKITDLGMPFPNKCKAIVKGGKVVKMTSLKKPVILKFDAQGYADGMFDVKGSLLKVTEFDYDEAYIKNKIENIVATAGEDDAVVDVELDYCEVKPTMIFGGYIRGKVEKGFLFDFDADMSVNLYIKYGSGDFDDSESLQPECTLFARATQEMEYFYQDVFGHYYPSDEEVEEFLRDNEHLEGRNKDEIKAMLTDMHYEDAEMNYKA